MPFDLPTNFDASLHQIVQAVVTVLAVINPVVCGAIFLTLTPKLAPVQRRSAAIRVALSILIILVASALIGLKVLGRLRHFIGCVPGRRRNDHCLYGLRHVLAGLKAFLA
jgi:hypothetical protein